MNEILLTGCAPTPLAHYLKALGVLKILSEQKDKNAKGCWTEDGFLLKTILAGDDLCDFFLEEYRPSPILAPWNGGSGFYYQEGKTTERDAETGKKKKTGLRDQATTATKTLDVIVSSKANRLQACVQIILALKQFLERFGFREAPKEEEKLAFIQHLRNVMDDRYLEALDSCVAITEDKLMFPPVFGSGGNDGHLDFTNNFYQQIHRLIDTETGQPTPASKIEIQNALFQKKMMGLSESAIGQFSPGHAGGPNNGNGFEGGGGINGWDYVLMIEGGLFFPSGVSRRLEHKDKAMLSFPFTVRATGSGAGNTALSDENDSRNEIWMPLWKNMVSLSELKFVFHEGRASLGRKNCRDGLDFAKAAALLGTDRGISSFQRFAFLKRSGKAYHATPLEKILVRNNPHAELITDLEKGGWLIRMRMAAREKGSDAATQKMVRLLENQMFDLANHPNRTVINGLISVVGHAALHQAIRRKLLEKNRNLPFLDSRWVKEADYGYPAFRIASALASIGTGESPSLRLHVFPLATNDEWSLQENGKTKLCTWSHAPLTTEICRIAERRLLASHQGKINFSLKGASPVNEAVIAEFLNHPEMDKAILELLPGLCLVRKHYPLPAGEKQEYMRTPLVYRLLKPFFCDHADLVEAGLLPEDVRLPLELSIIRYLSGNQVDRAITTAVRRLRVAGLEPPKALPDTGGVHGKRLLTALMIPVHTKTLQSMAAATFKTSRREVESSQKTLLISTED